MRIAESRDAVYACAVLWQQSP